MTNGASGADTGVRKLLVYERSMQLVENVYQVTTQLPASEQCGLTSQIRRAAISVPLNIAEGLGRQHRRDYSRFLAIARGSVYEVDTALDVACRLKLLSAEDTEASHGLCVEVIKMLTTMMKRLEG